MRKNKILYLKKYIIIITVSISLCTFLGCSNPFKYYSYKEYGTYDNFTFYQSDFECIKNLVQNHGEGVYYIDIENEQDVYGIQDNTIITISYNSKYSLEEEYLDLSDNEMNSLKTILINSYGYEYNFHPFEWIYVTEDYVFFQYDAIGSGIMYSNDIKNAIKVYDSVNSNEIGYDKLEDNWYGVYR